MPCVQVVGHGRHMKGTSQKNGKPYDFMEVTYTFERRGYEGSCCDKISIPGSLIDLDSLVTLGAELFFDFDQNGNLIDVTLPE